MEERDLSTPVGVAPMSEPTRQSVAKPFSPRPSVVPQTTVIGQQMVSLV